MNDPKQTDAEFTTALFRELPQAEPSAHLKRTLAQIPIEHPRERFFLWPFQRVWQPALGLAALALLGVFTGQGIETRTVTSASVATPLIALSESTQAPSVQLLEDETWSDEELDELFESALLEEFDEQWDDESLIREDPR